MPDGAAYFDKAESIDVVTSQGGTLLRELGAAAVAADRLGLVAG